MIFAASSNPEGPAPRMPALDDKILGIPLSSDFSIDNERNERMIYTALYKLIQRDAPE